MSKDKQSTDAVNASRSGGVNNQTGTLSAVEHKAAMTSPSINRIPEKGTSNHGK